MRKLNTYGIDELFPGSDYDSDEVEMLRAIDRYRIQHRKQYISHREAFRIFKSLGYVRFESKIVSHES